MSPTVPCLRLLALLLPLVALLGGCGLFGEHYCQPDARVERVDQLERENAELRAALAAAAAARAVADAAQAAAPARGAGVQVAALEVESAQMEGGVLYGAFGATVVVRNESAVSLRNAKVLVQLLVTDHGYPKAKPAVTERLQALPSLAPGGSQTLRFDGFRVGHPEESHVLVAQVLCPAAAEELECGLRQQRLRVAFPPGSQD